MVTVRAIDFIGRVYSTHQLVYRCAKKAKKKNVHLGKDIETNLTKITIIIIIIIIIIVIMIMIISNSNWTELSTIEGVIAREISSRTSAKPI